MRRFSLDILKPLGGILDRPGAQHFIMRFQTVPQDGKARRNNAHKRITRIHQNVSRVQLDPGQCVSADRHISFRPGDGQVLHLFKLKCTARQNTNGLIGICHQYPGIKPQGVRAGILGHVERRRIKRAGIAAGRICPPRLKAIL